MFQKKWDHCHMITSACLLCGAVYCWLWLILSKIVLDLLQLNSIYGESGFCCLCSEKKMEGVRVHSNTHEIAAGSIFCHNLVWWFECMCSKAITNQRIRLTWYAGRNSREREGGRQSEGSAVLLCGICKYWGFFKKRYLPVRYMMNSDASFPILCPLSLSPHLLYLQ